MLDRVQAITTDDGPDMVAGIPKLRGKLKEHLANSPDDVLQTSYHVRSPPTL